MQTCFQDKLSMYGVGGPHGSGPATFAGGKDTGTVSEWEKACAWE